uniref:Uncharacterized protein n=1 Tax=Cacopsylla melanoneura TaxID=428564 RepID=A0A8D8VUY7_9HEMI
MGLLSDIIKHYLYSDVGTCHRHSRTYVTYVVHVPTNPQNFNGYKYVPTFKNLVLRYVPRYQPSKTYLVVRTNLQKLGTFVPTYKTFIYTARIGLNSPFTPIRK